MATSRRREERRILTLCFLTDALAFWLVVSAVTLTRLHTLIYYPMWRIQLDRAGLVVLFAVVAVLAGAYSISRVSDRFDAVYSIWTSLGLTGVILLCLIGMLPRESLTVSRREAFSALVLGIVVLSAWRFWMVALVSRFQSLRRFFFVLGSEDSGKRIAEEITRAPGLHTQAEYLTWPAFKDRVASREPGTPADETHVGNAIIALNSRERDELAEMLEFSRGHCRRVFIYPCLHDTVFFQHSGMVAVAGIPLIEASATASANSYLYLKRLIDILASATGLLLASPLCLAAAIAVKTTSRGSLFFTQERMGKNGHIFKLYKFRSMVSDAEARTGPVWAKADDDRVTPVGRFIRRHRIDEIPQLLNVLKGDMSLVGPRPERPFFHEEFCRKWPLFDRRLAVRPGVTSLSHVRGTYGSDPRDRLRYDLVYIGNMSLLSDIIILAATVRVVLGAKGAH